MIIIKIYNLKNTKQNVYINNKNYFSKNGKLTLNIPKGVYKIQVYNQTQIVYYFKDNIIVPFIFECKNNYRKKVIHLTDYYYEGLKIERGEIFLNGI